MNSKTIILGDVHGCYEELLRLLEKCEYQSNDKLISVGDLIHKGPQSLEVLRFFKEEKAVLVIGNHEEKHLRWLNKEKLKQPNKMQHVEEYPELSNLLDDSDIEYMQNSYLSYQHDNYLIVHAGIPSALKEHPRSLLFKDIPSKKGILSQLLRIRYETPEGKMVSLGNEKPEDTYWAAKYNGQFGHVLFGHQPFMQTAPAEFPYATGLDLGCVYGGRLCALILQPEVAPQFKTIKALKAYKEQFQY